MMTKDAESKRSIESVKQFCVYAMEQAALGGQWRDLPRVEQARSLGIQAGFFAKIVQPAYPGPAGEWWALVAVACWKAWSLASSDAQEKSDKPSVPVGVDFSRLETTFFELGQMAGIVDMSMGLDHWAGGQHKMSIVTGFSACKDSGWAPEEGLAGTEDGARDREGGLAALRVLCPDIQGVLPESAEDWREIMESFKQGEPVDSLAWIEQRILARASAEGQTKAIRSSLRI